MSLRLKPLLLDPAPQSVRRARRWVTDVLSKLGRDDLVDSAELGVSELVTNAILHAESPIAVRVRGTAAHPRVEVHDASHDSPTVNADMTGPDALLSTVGRGMGIVALSSAIWGSEVTQDGKTVWFEPSAEPSDHRPRAAGVRIVPHGTQQPHPDASEIQRVPLTLLNLPVSVYVRSSLRYSELCREMRLLAISHGEEYPVASEFTALAVQVEQERRQTMGREPLAAAIEAGLDSLDLEYLVPVSAARTMTAMQEAMALTDQFCRDQKLLTLATSPQLLALQRWYVGEFVRQAGGEPPLPWSGSLLVEDDAAAW